MMRTVLPPPPADAGYDIGQNFMSALAIGGAAIVCTFALLAFYFCRYVAIGQRSREAAGDHHSSSCCEARPGAAALDSLPVVSSGEVAKLKGAMVDECCAVCLTEFGDVASQKPVRLLPKCGHCFHCECVDGWLQSHLLCPVCRTSVALPVPASDEQNVLPLEALPSVQETEQQQQQHVVIVVDEGQTPMLQEAGNAIK